MNIYIDESGTLPDRQDPYVVLAAVSASSAQNLLIPTKKVRRFIKSKTQAEIKFYHSGERTKTKFIKTLAQQNPHIFTLIIQKSNQSIPDNPFHYAILSQQLIIECLNYFNHKKLKLYFDRHFHKIQDQTQFNQQLTTQLGQQLPIFHVDSQQYPQINTADMIAGSTLWAKTNKNNQFYQLIKDQIIIEKTINWKQIKQQYWHKKIRLNRRKRPSKSNN